MPDVEVAAFVRANLPPPPCRVLEVGAGEGELAASLAAAGYAVTAIDPDPRGDNVERTALADVDPARDLCGSSRDPVAASRLPAEGVAATTCRGARAGGAAGH